MYDCTNEKSFSNVHNWLQQIDEHAYSGINTILVATKTDLADKRQVSFNQGQQLAEQHKMKFYETSALTGDGVSDAFTGVVK